MYKNPRDDNCVGDEGKDNSDGIDGWQLFVYDRCDCRRDCSLLFFL